MTRDHDAHDVIARSYCRAFSSLACPCNGDPQRCHAGTLFYHEAAAAVVALRKRNMLNDNEVVEPWPTTA